MNLHIQGLRFGYRGHPVLKRIDLDVPSGKLCALLGENGAGKTTLLKCIGGILRPAEGHVHADDTDLLAMSPKKRAALIGYVPQNVHAANSSLNVLETVLSGRVPHKRGRLTSEDRDIALHVMEAMRLEHYALRELGQLSGGERQRVFIARAMAQRPKAMLLDEPTSNLDMHYQQETMEVLCALCAEQKMTILTILHDLNTVIAYADMAVLLKDGEVFQKGNPSDVLEEKTIEEIYHIRTAFATLDGVRYVVPQHKKRPDASGKGDPHVRLRKD